jgi:hypothetical protein
MEGVGWVGVGHMHAYRVLKVYGRRVVVFVTYVRLRIRGLTTGPQHWMATTILWSA